MAVLGPLKGQKYNKNKLTNIFKYLHGPLVRKKRYLHVRSLRQWGLNYVQMKSLAFQMASTHEEFEVYMYMQITLTHFRGVNG